MTWVRVAAAAALLLILLAVFSFVLRVPAGSIAVVESGPAGTAPTVLQPGLHLRMPGNRVSLYSSGEETATGEVMVTPSSGGEVPLRYNVKARLDPDHVAQIHAAMSGRPFPEFLQAQAGAMLRKMASGVQAVDLLTPAFREKAGSQIAAAMSRGGLADAEVEVGPPDDETLMAAAQYLASRGEASMIRETVSERLLSPEGSRSWRVHTAMGYINESEKRLLDAERSYLDALAIEPTALAPMAQLVTLYSAVQDWFTLLRVLDAALTARPDSPQHLTWAAMVMTRQGDLAGAERMLNRGLEADPDNATLMTNLGALKIKTGHPDEAIELLRKAVDMSPDSQQTLFNLGSALAAEDRPAEALPFLERAAAAGPMNAPLARTLGMVLQKTGDAPRGAGYLKQAEALEAARPRPPAPARGGAPPGGA